MDWLYKLSIYISITWSLNPSKAEEKVIDAEMTAFFNRLVQDLVLYIPIHL
ncbi:hypothetical protein [Dendronalium sp. ChiSLP03b]|uniref:hypothetical protein n=1 Tax=Dendronalium sp. ChiSLP03b TaxID=3075381 RepID=UPI00269155E1|nr:hypothetical protein [Dendronalium sp. ChiSLP03b]MDZ8203682.1 hypothetical protein [Dendronalium sp. ChiSLP03b]